MTKSTGYPSELFVELWRPAKNEFLLRGRQGWREKEVKEEAQ